MRSGTKRQQTDKPAVSPVGERPLRHPGSASGSVGTLSRSSVEQADVFLMS